METLHWIFPKLHINWATKLLLFVYLKLTYPLMFSWEHMGSFPHPTHYYAAAGENDDFVIAAINFMLNQSLWFFFMLLICVYSPPDFKFEENRNFLKIFKKSHDFRFLPEIHEIFKIFFKNFVCLHIWKLEGLKCK